MSDLDNMGCKKYGSYVRLYHRCQGFETFKEFNLTPTRFGVMDVLNAKGRMIGELIRLHACHLPGI